MESLIFNQHEVAIYYRNRIPRLRQTGATNWSGRCPVHGGEGMNFSVRSDTGLWHCFSQCSRGGSMVDLEMELTGADFVTARAAVCDIVGRPLPERDRLTAEQWRAQKNARAQEERDRRDAAHFAVAARIMAEEALEQIGPFEEERAIHARLIADLRRDEYATWLDWKARTPVTAESLRKAGFRSQTRQEQWLWKLIGSMAREQSKVQFEQVHREEKKDVEV